MKEKLIRIHRTPEFRRWYQSQTDKSQVQIDCRLLNIQGEGHFGDHKSVGNQNEEVWELRWKNGRRIYFTYLPKQSVLLLIGGNKNGQKKDIKRAKSLLKKYTE